MKNKIFQWLWYRIFKNIIPSNGTGPEKRHKQFVFMLGLARLFGGARGVIFGDSEISAFDSYEVMREFNTIVLNFGVAGTVSGEWCFYFNWTGTKIYDKISKLKQVISIGGNYSLRSMMPVAEYNMKSLHEMFPLSWIILVPPVYTNVLGLILKTEAQWGIEIDTIRRFQREIWVPRIIDTYSPFVDDDTGYPLPWVLKDVVHFSKQCALLIQKALDIVI